MELNVICDYNDEGIDLFISYRNGVCRLTISNRCPNVAFFSTLVADRANRCGGIGTMLLKQAQETAVDYGCTVMTLQAKYQSWQAAWYRRKGFEPVCDGYDPDMVMMSKRLKQKK